MNAISSSTTRWLLICLCVAILLPASAGSVFASSASDSLAVSVPILHADAFLNWMSDRGHMIQFSLVIVTVGIVVIWWYR